MSHTKQSIQALLIEKGLHQVSDEGKIIVVDPIELLGKYSIELREGDLSNMGKNTCGFIRRIAGKYQIIVEKENHIHRKRFTIAHELGHYFLHMQSGDEDVFVDNKECLMFRDGKYDRYEREANMFAAEYLMPEITVKDMYEQYGVTEILAGYFQVSRVAMAIRIDNIFERYE